MVLRRKSNGAEPPLEAKMHEAKQANTPHSTEGEEGDDDGDDDEEGEQ